MENRLPDNLRWFKAQASESANGCVEIAHLPDGGVAVRNSRSPEDTVVAYSAWEWDCFIDGAKKGEFDRPAT